jgi:glycerol uptake facilitator-like aquaporin
MPHAVQSLAPDSGRKFASELVGTGMLLAAVVGSGIMGERLANGNAAIALLANSVATAAALAAIIAAFGPISGAHLNPVVTLSDALQGGLAWREAAVYLLAQLLGAFSGVAVANAMFGLPAFTASQHIRTGGGQLFGEVVATFGLLAVIRGSAWRRPTAMPGAVACYIAAAYWFTSSTSFANPAVTLARAATDTFAGIRPLDVPGFVGAQLLGGGLATLLFRWLVPAAPLAVDLAIVPRETKKQYGK